MHTIALIIQLSIPILLAKAALRDWAYTRPVQRLLRSLAERRSARKAYALALAILILVWNFVCFLRFGASSWLLPGLAVGMLLLSFKAADAILRWGGRRRILLYAVFCASVITLAIPQLISFTMVLILLPPAAWLYPSKTVIEETEDWLAGKRCEVNMFELVQYYFRDRYDEKGAARGRRSTTHKRPSGAWHLPTPQHTIP